MPPPKLVTPSATAGGRSMLWSFVVIADPSRSMIVMALTPWTMASELRMVDYVFEGRGSFVATAGTLDRYRTPALLRC